MSIKIGDINIAQEIVELHFQLTRTQLILENVLNKNPQLRKLSKDELEEIERKTLALLIDKFPNMNIGMK